MGGSVLLPWALGGEVLGDTETAMRMPQWGYGRSRLGMAGRKKEGPRFSQFDEEPILRGLLGHLVTGRCVDIGARERRGSNVASFIDVGWDALLVDQNVNGLLRDFPAVKYPTVTILQKVVTAKNVNEVLRSWHYLDLLSIDIDGPDAEVWEAVEVRPAVLCIEAVPENRPKIVKVSEERGYKLHAETGPNLIYVR